ncbi:MAG: sugar ABC transporter permease [Halanaerobiales bacterium]|nr:sugar ABC transporter permease [Halanaerobiales bacterium]
MKYKKITPWLFLIPTLLGLIFFRLGPMLAAGLASFTRWNVFSPPEWIGFGNYIELFNSGTFQMILKNTFIFSGLFVPGVMAAALFLALLVNNKLRGMTFFRGLFYLPVITSVVSVGVIWSWILSPRFGLLYQLVNKFFDIARLPSFLGQPEYALYTLIFVYVWKMAGYQMILFLAGLQNIPQVYYEAATIDGASIWQKFRYITLPLLTPTTFFVLIISIIMSLKTFELTYIMTQGGPNYASTTLIYSIYVNAFKHFRMGFASAMSYILFIIVAVFTYLNFKFKKRWVHYSE